MLKTGLSRPAALCRLAVQVARPIRIAPRAAHFPTLSTRTAPLRFATRAFTTQSRLLDSAQAEATEGVLEPEESGLITRFADLGKYGIDQRIVRSIVGGMGYEKMSEVQAKTIESTAAGKDVVAQARTGTGKTLAFLMPIVNKILASDPKISTRTARSDDIRAIIISPTRELAEQIGVEAKKLCEGTGIVVQIAVGGVAKSHMLRQTRQRGCHLLVATPGRLNDLLSDKYSGIDAPQLDALVLDEADRMLEVGFDRELNDILELLPNRREKPRQTLLFSATLPRDVISLARNYVDPSNFEFVQTVSNNETPTHERVPQHIVPCHGLPNLLPTLLELLKRENAKAQASPDSPPFKAMVFLPTTASVELAFATFMNVNRDRELPFLMNIHSQLTQQQRTRAADTFRASKSAILFSSDVTARGMDFPNVTHVIQVVSPSSREQYIHRLGRTGRAEKSGEGWLLIANMELPVARRRLVDLPLQRKTDFVNASYDAGRGLDSAPEEFKVIANASSSFSRDLYARAYTGFLGGAMKGVNGADIVPSLNIMATQQWGLQEPPEVSPNMARNLPGVRGLNIRRGGGMSRDDRGSDRYGGRDDDDDPFGALSRGSGGGFGRRDNRRGSFNDRGSFSDRSDRGSFNDRRFGGRGSSGGRSSYNDRGSFGSRESPF